MPLPQFKIIGLSHKKLLLIPIITLLLIALFWSGYTIWQHHFKQPAPPDTIKLSLAPNPLLSLQVLIADSQGFYQEENLEVNISLRSAANLQAEVAAAAADLYTCGLEELLFDYLQNQQAGLQIIAQLTRQDPSFLMSREPAEQFSWDNCSGSSVITGSWEYGPALVLEAIGREHNLLPQRNLIFLQNLPADLQAAAFASGSGTYLQICEPQASYLETTATAYKVLTLGTAAPEIAASILCASSTYLQRNDQAIQKFINAMQKSCLWLQDQNPDSLLPLIQNRFPEYNKEVLLKAIEQYYNQNLWTHSIVIDEAAYYAYQTLLVASGELEQEFPASKLVNNYHARQAVQHITWQPPDTEPSIREKLQLWLQSIFQ